ncbi:MAG TPA: hypothetical protein VHT01_07125 [Candidatus Udaeobacter sp.]|nr:hypothetical protein [Candidatus Udaeobacter sp.]
MSRTIEPIVGHMPLLKRMPTYPKRLTANWQFRLEAGGHVQRKLRLVLRVCPPAFQ